MMNDAGITVPEVVGLFSGRDNFEAAVSELKDTGFERADLSVLSSHESIDAAAAPGTPWKDALTALVGELKYEGPMVASGAIYLAGGEIAALAAGIIGTAVGGIAVKEILDEVTSAPNTDDFARSLDAGSVILWVRAADTRQQDAAIKILERHGATNVHIHREATNDK